MSKRLLVIGVVLGLITVVLVNICINRIKSEQTSLPFLRLKPDTSLAKGQRIQLDKLRTEYLPDSFESLTQTAISDANDSREWIKDRPVTKDVPPGSFLLHEHFADIPGERFAAQISVNMRAITIPVSSATAVAYFVEPGSRVDILGTFEHLEQEELRIDVPENQSAIEGVIPLPKVTRTTVTKTILQNVRVLAVGQATTHGNYLGSAAQGFDTVTVEVSPDDAEKLVFAMSQAIAGLTLVLRNPDDEKFHPIPSMSWDSLK